MATDAKKHTTIAPGEAPTRAALAASLLSMNDIVPAANATEQAQLVTALASTPVPVGSSRPLATLRADAAPLHALEYTKDGSVWLSVSGVLHFASLTTRNSWTTANSAYLTAGDRCVCAGFDGRWNGSKWIQDSNWATLTLNSGWSAYLGETPKWRIQAGILFCSGRISAAAGVDSKFATLPSEAWHTTTVEIFRSHIDNNVSGITVGSDGVMSVFEPASSIIRSGVALSSVIYPVG